MGLTRSHAGAPGRRWLAVGAPPSAAPAVTDDAMLRTLAGVFMFAGLASAWNIIGGFTGYASFGNVVFFGLGGYTVAVLMVHARWGFWIALPVAVAVGAGYAALVGLPVLRLRGHYFAIATLGVAEGTREVVLNLSGLTGGGAGISLPVLGAKAVTASPGNTGFYYLFLAAMGVTVAVSFAVSRSRFGYGLRAIHDDEQGAAATGINTTRAKLAAFALSGALTSLIGALFAFQQVAIYPGAAVLGGDHRADGRDGGDRRGGHGRGPGDRRGRAPAAGRVPAPALHRPAPDRVRVADRGGGHPRARRVGELAVPGMAGTAPRVSSTPCGGTGCERVCWRPTASPATSAA